ncbi:prepilin-type N-terminal cleavage/methylation domain-containing protein [Candidatus Dependentiae bacterium]|nr:prepilin-type N-terminal cleavage/methylation domain-containing protein [Candidatus Dependentiae bacterium]MBU4387441.1 prepilin-type N-terminal cleavage/methylation domain-containing protein [Candidatus Dependentiae bacterium]
MKKNKAFTLLEVIISLGISAFIIFGVMRIYLNLQNIIDKTYLNSKYNKKVYIFLNQIEKDISTMLAIDSHDEIDKKQDNKKENKKDEKKDNKNYLKTAVYDIESFKYMGKKYEIFKSLSFISTNSYEIYDEKNVKLVRVGYFLEKNKEKSVKDNIVYKLFRKETYDLNNIDFKSSDDFKDSKIRSFLIADNIKEFSIEYQLLKKEDKNKEINLFTWGQKDETKNLLPNYAFLVVSFWNDKLTESYFFTRLINIFSAQHFNETNAKEEKNMENGNKN